MPRHASQNLAAIDPEYRKANNIGQGGGDPKKRRYAYGKQNNILVAQGAELFANGFTIRLLPIYEESGRDAQGNRQFANFREGRGNAAFGDWCRIYTCANWVGNPGVCFVIHDGDETIDLWDSPYHVLRKAAWDSKDVPGIGKIYSELLSKNFVPNSHVGSLRKPENTLFVSASAVGVGPDGLPTLLAFGDDKKRNARIVGLKTSAAQALNAALAVRDEATGEYASGDMLSFGPAKLITFVPETYTGGHNARNSNAVSAQGPTGVQIPKYAQQQTPVLVGNCASPSSMTHRVVIHDAYNGHEVSLEPYAEKLVAETLSWDEYMWVPTYEEQAEMLSKAFPREALEHAWQEHPQYLRTLPRGTTTVDFSERDVEDLEQEDIAPAVAPRQSFTRPAPVPQTAPAAAPQGELTEDEAAGVDDMFAAAVPPPSPGAPASRVPAGTKVEDIIAKARAAAARNR